MEHNKKDYLFRLGPVTFFPKDPQPKPPAYLDSFEFYRNLSRVILIVFYSVLFVFTLSDLQGGKEFLGRFNTWPTSYYFIFFFPLALSLIDLYLFWLERKTNIPMRRHSWNFMRISWFVSTLFYLGFLFSLLN